MGVEANEPFPEEVEIKDNGEFDDIEDLEDLDPETEQMWRNIDKADHPSSLYKAKKENNPRLPN